MRRVILLVWLLGCGEGGSGSGSVGGAGGTVPPATGGSSASTGNGGAAATGGSAGGGVPGTGGATGGGGGSATDGMVGGTGGTNPSGGSGGGTDAGSQSDTSPAPIQACASESGFTVSGCGYLGANSQYVFRKMGGASCRACSVQPAGRQVTGCAPEPGHLCVAACTACCYDKPGSVCESDADCCAHLHCKEGDPGKNKTCQ
jgi:hypothetical protein